MPKTSHMASRMANEIRKYVAEDVGHWHPYTYADRPCEIPDASAGTLRFTGRSGLIEVDVLWSQYGQYASVITYRGGYKITSPVYTANATAHAAGDIVRSLAEDG